MPYKPVDTAIKVIVGPAIDDGDFKAREEGLTYNQAGMEVDVILEKHDGTVTTTAVTPTSGGLHDWAHTDQGYYELEIPATGGDYANTEEGILRVVVFCTGVLPFSSVAYDVVATQVYDSLVKGSDYLQTDMTQISGSGTAANNVEAVFLGTGDTANVDIVARSLKLNSDTGVAFEILSSNDSAIKAVSSASGKHGMELAGYLTGEGLVAIGGATGHGIQAQGGATSGQGIFAVANTAGAGILARGGSSSGAGLKSEAQANDDAGMELVKHGSGKDLDADETDVIATINTQIGTAGAGLTDLSLSTAGIKAIWDQATSALTTVGSLGKLLVDNINATISSRSSHAAADVWSVGTRTLSSFGTLVADVWGYTTRALTNKVGFSLSASGIDAIWDELQSGHTTAGTFGKYLDAQVSLISAAGIADAVWNEPIADHDTSGTTGEALDIATRKRIQM